MFSVKAEAGRDRINGTYYTLGGFASVGLQLENLLRGESPFTLPDPIFKSPRDLRRLLVLKVKRNWHQPTAVILARSITRSNSNPTPQCRDSLPGSVLSFTGAIAPNYAFVGFTPPITPVLNPSSVHVCWCGVQYTVIDVQFYICDGIQRHRTIVFDMNTTDGCADPDMMQSSYLSSSPRIYQIGTSDWIYFTTGGGISFALKP